MQVRGYTLVYIFVYNNKKPVACRLFENTYTHIIVALRKGNNEQHNVKQAKALNFIRYYAQRYLLSTFLHNAAALHENMVRSEAE